MHHWPRRQTERLGLRPPTHPTPTQLSPLPPPQPTTHYGLLAWERMVQWLAAWGNAAFPGPQGHHILLVLLPPPLPSALKLSRPGDRCEDLGRALSRDRPWSDGWFPKLILALLTFPNPRQPHWPFPLILIAHGCHGAFSLPFLGLWGSALTPLRGSPFGSHRSRSDTWKAAPPHHPLAPRAALPLSLSYDIRHSVCGHVSSPEVPWGRTVSCSFLNLQFLGRLRTQWIPVVCELPQGRKLQGARSTTRATVRAGKAPPQQPGLQTGRHAQQCTLRETRNTTSSVSYPQIFSLTKVVPGHYKQEIRKCKYDSFVIFTMGPSRRNDQMWGRASGKAPLDGAFKWT